MRRRAGRASRRIRRIHFLRYPTDKNLFSLILQQKGHHSYDAKHIIRIPSSKPYKKVNHVEKLLVILINLSHMQKHGN